MFHIEQFCKVIIRPALELLNMHSDVAEQLLAFTCAVESDGGTFVTQLGGPALGIYQMEPETYTDLWQNYIYKKPSLTTIMISNFDCNRIPSEERMIYDLRYATAMARIFYFRVPERLPPRPDPISLWKYYKTYYNTYLGKANQLTALQKYYSFADPKS